MHHSDRQPHRRDALVLGASALFSCHLAGHGAAAEPVDVIDPNKANSERASAKHSICVFTKPFNSLSFDELADRIAELGFDGIEAPIRQGGHVEPEQVEERLPQLVEALAKRDLEITVMTSDVNDPSDPLTHKVLRTAAGLGIRQYRMKYLHYDLSRPVMDQLKEWRPRFRDLAALNGELGIQGLYQNHAGSKNLGGSLWDVRHVLEGISPQQLGVAYDIRHATVEGGTSWPVSFNMIRPHIQCVYVKDFRWGETKPQNVPLGEGRISADFFSLLKKSKYTGPISLHEEYLDHKDPKLVQQHVAAIKQDLAKLRSWL